MTREGRVVRFHEGAPPGLLYTDVLRFTTYPTPEAAQTAVRAARVRLDVPVIPNARSA